MFWPTFRPNLHFIVMLPFQIYITVPRLPVQHSVQHLRKFVICHMLSVAPNIGPTSKPLSRLWLPWVVAFWFPTGAGSCSSATPSPFLYSPISAFSFCLFWMGVSRTPRPLYSVELFVIGSFSHAYTHTPLWSCMLTAVGLSSFGPEAEGRRAVLC